MLCGLLQNNATKSKVRNHCIIDCWKLFWGYHNWMNPLEPVFVINLGKLSEFLLLPAFLAGKSHPSKWMELSSLQFTKQSLVSTNSPKSSHLSLFFVPHKQINRNKGRSRVVLRFWIKAKTFEMAWPFSKGVVIQNLYF